MAEKRVSFEQVRLWQCGQMMPRQLGRHMEMHGALPVLFVSSWLLTAFAADFPLSFTARVMDAILADSYVEPVMKVWWPLAGVV